MTDTNNPSLAPVALPARSFDYDTLKEALEPAAGETDEAKRDQLIADAIDTGKSPSKEMDPRSIEGDKFKTVTRTLAPDVKVTEKIQVFDVAKAEEAAAAEEPARAAGETERVDKAPSSDTAGAAPRGSAPSKEK